jgi:hypothetical protein
MDMQRMIDAKTEQRIWALFLEFCAVFDQAIDELAAIHGLGRLQLSKAEVDGLKHDAKTLMLEFGEGREDDIAGRYRTKDTTRLRSYLRQCNDICLRATNAQINRVALTLH